MKDLCKSCDRVFDNIEDGNWTFTHAWPICSVCHMKPAYVAQRGKAFAEASFDDCTMEDLVTAINTGPDPVDMKTWGIDSITWVKSIGEAIKMRKEAECEKQ